MLYSQCCSEGSSALNANVCNATGDYRTQFHVKAEKIAEALSAGQYEFGFLHIKAVDDTGHDQQPVLKVWCHITCYLSFMHNQNSMHSSGSVIFMLQHKSSMTLALTVAATYCWTISAVISQHHSLNVQQVGIAAQPSSATKADNVQEFAQQGLMQRSVNTVGRVSGVCGCDAQTAHTQAA